MGKNSGTSRNKRAGLNFSISRTRNQIRRVLTGSQRVQKGVDTMVTALCEYPMERLLAGASDRITTGKHIHAIHLFGAINDAESEVKNIFPRHATGLFAK